MDMGHILTGKAISSIDKRLGNFFRRGLISKMFAIFYLAVRLISFSSLSKKVYPLYNSILFVYKLRLKLASISRKTPAFEY